MNMFFLVWFIALSIGEASVITTISRDSLGVLAKRWQPNVADIDDKAKLISTIKGGTQRYTNMVINCYCPDVTYGLIHLDHREKISIFAIRNNSTLVSSLTAIIEDDEFREIAREVTQWHKAVLNKRLWISDEYSKTVKEDDADI